MMLLVEADSSVVVSPRMTLFKAWQQVCKEHRLGGERTGQRK